MGGFCGVMPFIIYIRKNIDNLIYLIYNNIKVIIIFILILILIEI